METALGLHLSGKWVNQDLPKRELMCDELDYLVSPSERAQVQRPVSSLEMLLRS